MSFFNILSIAGQLILCLSILVVLHECGHFFPARWFKTRVDKFYLFFDAYFSLWKKKIGDTEYGIGWIPFGGYVKIAGMIDESMDKEQMQGPPQPWEFRSKKAWQRLIIMVGGVVVNFILGFFIFGMLLFAYGKSYIKTEDLKYGIAVDSLGMQLGLEDGDKILAVGDYKMDRFNQGAFINEIILNNADNIKVERDGNTVDLPLDKTAIDLLTNTENKGKTIFAPRFPQEISEVISGKVGDKAGLKKGDRIIKINNINTEFHHDFVAEATIHKNDSIALTVLRGIDTLQLTANMDSTGLFSIGNAMGDKFITESKEKYSLAQAIPGGVKEGVGFLSSQLKAFGQMFKGKISAKDNLGSVFTIATLFDPSWNWERFWRITAMLSIILGFFNILPIPALDGGYVLFLLWEMLTGKKPNDKFMEYVTIGGFIILMSLMIFALGLDITRLFK